MTQARTGLPSVITHGKENRGTAVDRICIGEKTHDEFHRP